MPWDSFLLLLTGLYATYKLAGITRKHRILKHLSFSLAAFVFSLGQANLLVSSFIADYQSAIDIALVTELTTISSVAFVLCGLALFIRESKPVFAQFPLIYAASPLLLIVSYFFVKDSVAIKNWLISIYQGGALLVALMMYSTQTYRNSYFAFLLGASILFSLTYICYWFLSGLLANYSWIWQLLIGLSIIVALKGFEQELSNHHQS